MRYRKKPVVIEAMQWDGSREIADKIEVWSGSKAKRRAPTVIEVRTEEGTMRALPDDWIIKGTAGEFYPCKPAIFDAIYEKAE